MISGSRLAVVGRTALPEIKLMLAGLGYLGMEVPKGHR
jgi:hypothetical protein